MPAYHSKITDVSSYLAVCGTAILPLKTSIKGNAPACPTDQVDIVDEALEYFRAQALFRSFKPEGPSDLLLAYLTIYIGELLRHLQRDKNVADARKNVIKISMSQTFAIPGDKEFCLGGFFSPPANRNDQDAIRTYLLQIRQELANRLIDIIYPEGNQSKWWFMYTRRKFLNIERT